MIRGKSMQRKNLKKIFFGFFLLANICLVAMPQAAFAFGSGAHYVVMEKTAEKLPKDSIIREAMLADKNIAAWGAVGPDIGYFNARNEEHVGEIMGGRYSPWGDAFHYDRVGSFAKKMLKDALASGDLKKIAFAAGYVTHITGDLNCHGTFVNPEAGVYLDCPSKRDIHTELEKSADPYIWVNFGGYKKSTYTNAYLRDKFATVLPTSDPATFFDQCATNFYGSISSPVTGNDLDVWLRMDAMKQALAGGYKYDDAEKKLKNGKKIKGETRIDRLDKAFNAAVTNAAVLLEAAERGDYKGFKDSWNLDAADDGRPIGTLTVNISTYDCDKAGTDDDIWFEMKLKSGEKYKRKLDKDGYNDFEKGDNDSYYLYVGDKKFDPKQITQVSLKRVPNGSDNGGWRLKSIIIQINGDIVYNKAYNEKDKAQWLTGTRIWSAKVKGL